MGSARPLRRILGLGFGLAFTFGTMVGVGILRLPGTVAAAAASPTLIIICWCVGALYALMGAVSVSELAAMYPEAGGFRVYARRAFGDSLTRRIRRRRRFLDRYFDNYIMTPMSKIVANVRSYRSRLLARPSVARVVEEARPFRHFFPLGAPDRD